MVKGLSSHLLLDDLNPKLVRHIRKIGINTFSLCRNIILFQLCHDLRHGQAVLIVCLFQHNSCQITEFQFLVGTSCHSISYSFCIF